MGFLPPIAKNKTQQDYDYFILSVAGLFRNMPIIYPLELPDNNHVYYLALGRI
jgi:hypothetical protein